MPLIAPVGTYRNDRVVAFGLHKKAVPSADVAFQHIKQRLHRLVRTGLARQRLERFGQDQAFLERRSLAQAHRLCVRKGRPHRLGFGHEAVVHFLDFLVLGLQELFSVKPRLLFALVEVFRNHVVLGFATHASGPCVTALIVFLNHPTKLEPKEQESSIPTCSMNIPRPSTSRPLGVVIDYHTSSALNTVQEIIRLPCFATSPAGAPCSPNVKTPNQGMSPSSALIPAETSSMRSRTASMQPPQ